MTRDRLIKLFTMDGKPYALSYRRRSPEHKQDEPVLKSMIKDGLVKIGEKDTKRITYYYIASHETIGAGTSR